jgi:hypothetical protein
MKLIPKRKLFAVNPAQVEELLLNIYQNTTDEIDDIEEESNLIFSGLVFVIDGGGSAITTGEHGHLVVPFNCEILSGELEADQAGDIKIDIWKDTYTNFPPTDADSICGGAELEISSDTQDKDSALTGWTTALSQSDILAFNVDSCSTIERCTLTLLVKKT